MLQLERHTLAFHQPFAKLGRCGEAIFPKNLQCYIPAVSCIDSLVYYGKTALADLIHNLVWSNKHRRIVGLSVK